MTERGTVEEKSRQTASERPTLFLTWKLNPTTGDQAGRPIVLQQAFIPPWLNGACPREARPPSLPN